MEMFPIHNNAIIVYTKLHLWHCFQYTSHMTPIACLGMARLYLCDTELKSQDYKISEIERQDRYCMDDVCD